MNTKTVAAIVAALVVGTSSAALADPQFDVNIYRPTVQDNALGAYAQQMHRAPVQAPSTAEKLWFERASSPRNS